MLENKDTITTKLEMIKKVEKLNQSMNIREYEIKSQFNKSIILPSNTSKKIKEDIEDIKSFIEDIGDKEIVEQQQKLIELQQKEIENKDNKIRNIKKKIKSMLVVSLAEILKNEMNDESKKCIMVRNNHFEQLDLEEGILFFKSIVLDTFLSINEDYIKLSNDFDFFTLKSELMWMLRYEMINELEKLKNNKSL